MHPLAREPFPTSAPKARAVSGSQVAPRAEPQGTQVEGALQSRQGIPTGAVGAVRDVELRNTQVLDPHGGPHILSRGESNLLFKRQCID